MKLENLITFFSSNPSAKLLRAQHAPYIIDFLHQHFKRAENLTSLHSVLQQQLNLYLENLHETEPEILREQADSYLNAWSTGESRWLRRFFDSQHAESVYQLTPHTEDILTFLTDILEGSLGFVGTESRLSRIIGTLSDIIVRGSDDPERRMKHLQAEKSRIEAEMRSIEGGNAVETHSPTAIRERFADAVSDLVSLLGDFRAVEESFKTITRGVQQRQAEAFNSRGDILGFALEAEDELKDQDQGASFQAFVRLILSQSQQDALELLIGQLDAIDELAGQAEGKRRVKGMIAGLSAEAEKILSVTRRLNATLRRLLDTRSNPSRMRVAELLPERYYRRVRSYVETNRIADGRGDGQKLDYICVGRPNEISGDRVGSHSLVNKLEFKPRHDLAPWVRGEINKRFDFHCCSSVEEFNSVPRMAITENRHVKFNSERHQKDDRSRTVDPRYFVLGWDNTEKKRLIVARLQELDAERETAQISVSTLGIQIEQLESVRRAALVALEVVDFDAIDLKRHEKEIAALQAEKKELEDANDTVKALQKRLKAIEGAEAVLAGQRDSLLEEKGKLEAEINRVKGLLQSATEKVNQARASGAFAKHEVYFAAIAESLGTPPLAIEDISGRQENWKDTVGQNIARLRKPLRELADRLVARMGAYLRDFREDSPDLDASVLALPSFMGRLEQLRREDLPRYEKKFKDRLNDQVTTEIAVFNTELREERKQIEEKIAQLNEALGEVEYNYGTHMRLEPQQVQDREIDEFRRALRECLDESLEHTDEANESRFVRVKALVERLADKDRTAWRNKVIDVRNWYDFTAQEIADDSGDVRSCYGGSSGQSGGEKAKLAFTILVAAIAYQFDVNPHGHTPGRFHFVVVDEMFSKVDDQNAQYALKLFNQFGLQLLIVAPLDAKARITEPFVDRYVHTVKDADTHCSQLYSMTAQEYEEVVKQFTGSASYASKRRMNAK